MKNFRFCTIAVILMAVIFGSGYSLLRSGEGLAVMTSARITASRNSEKIQDSVLEPYDKEAVTLSGEAKELTADTLDSVVIDGMEYAFPIRMGDLSDDFGYSLTSAGVEENVPGKYSGTLMLSYKNRFIATAIYESDRPGADEDAVIVALIFRSKTNKYLPQITVGGIDVNNADIREVNRVYGYDSDEYGYTVFTADSKDGTYRMTINWADSSVQQLRFKDKDSEAFDQNRSIVLYSDKVYLPENYSVEEDITNSEMEYIPLPEKNEEFLELMDIIPVGETTLQLPCTLNSLMSRVGDNAYFEYYSKVSYEYDCGVYCVNGGILFGDDQKIKVSLLITPGKPIGDAQVIEVNFDADLDFVDLLDVNGENPYGFIPDEQYKNMYYLTDLEYNNLRVQYDDFKFFYWGENLKER